MTERQETVSYGLKAGDLEPPMAVSLTELGGSPIDLTAAASVTAYIRRHGADPADTIERAAVITDRVGGRIEVVWEAGDTDQPGTYAAEFVIAWPDDRQQTVPTSGTVRFRIEDDLEPDTA